MLGGGKDSGRIVRCEGRLWIANVGWTCLRQKHELVSMSCATATRFKDRVRRRRQGRRLDFWSGRKERAGDFLALSMLLEP